MYRWYQDSVVCYAYLADVPPPIPFYHDTGAAARKLRKSRWFKRGWTLQELIAPSIVVFLDQEWQEFGTKSSLQRELSEITGISTNILSGGDVESVSVAQRMSWACKRETTRVEDLAYSLMGIFGINMPLLYGEGERAFIRLQEEIIKVSDDHSIFAWTSWDVGNTGLLATSPAAFLDCGDVKVSPVESSSASSGAITMNNKGIHLKLPFKDVHFQGAGLAVLPCMKDGKPVAIYLRPMSATYESFTRVQNGDLVRLDPGYSSDPDFHQTSICVQQERRIHKNGLPLQRASASGHGAIVKFLLEKGAEIEARDENWDRTPLLWAACNGHNEVISFLLQKGAALECKDVDGRTPLMYAVANGREATVRLLLEKGAAVNSNTNFAHTPLILAIESRREGIVELLLKNGVEIEVGDSHGRTPLLLAAASGLEGIVKLLLEKCANVEAKDNYGRTPLTTALDRGHEGIKNLMLASSAGVRSRHVAKIRDTYVRPLSWGPFEDEFNERWPSP
ncbi:hypothetical protein G7Y89_g7852 [Cudoniella acicularis]|uniref:DUF8212 domain-containing protein n=1 Tax=Cudoniella acicularis TaxID=354080 RepID=A0A8H4RHR2_9HELO|nr:hypothetical protein G7Y89_g7852 [Cudoniella acicularis]